MNMTFLTGNENKLREAEGILELKLKHHNLDLDEIQSLDPKTVAHHKVLQAWSILQEPVFTMDQSVYISCLNNFPGPLIKWFWETVTLEKICDMAEHFQDNKIYTETTLTYYDGTEVVYFSDRIHGHIPSKPKGQLGWGWDSIFIPEGFEKTYAEIDPSEVIHIRTHTKPLKQLKEFLSKK